ncbi:MAG: ABC transporter permease [Dehalococcoidia bacterium]
MNHLAGTSSLVRLILRRDRLVLPLWIAVLAALPLVTVVSFEELFPTETQRQGFFIATASQPSYTGLLGPGFGASLGALATQRAGILFLFVALATLLTVIRHTRSEEETGRRELLGATVVGREAPLTAALLVACGASVLLGMLIAVSLAVGGLPLAGSVAFGGAIAATGCVFAAGGALVAQLTEGAGAARGIALAVLGVVFLLRGAGDAAGADGALRWLAWLSPIGWMQRTRAFADERWWVFLLALAAFAVLGLAAYALASRRDVGAGVFPRRLGRAEAVPGLRRPLALAWRLHQGALWGWVGALAVLGVVIGAVSPDAAQAMEDNEQLMELVRRLGGGAVVADAYLSAMMGFLGFVVSGYAVQATLRLRAEEESQRGELVLATSVHRLRWALSHLCFALLGPTMALATLGVVAGVVYGAIVGDIGGQAPRILAAALVQLPAAWLLAGVTMALFGMRSSAAGLAWALLAAWLLLGQFGAVLQLPAWVLDLSPFSHLPPLPGGEVTVVPLLALSGLAAAGIAFGLAALQRRDFGV